MAQDMKYGRQIIIKAESSQKYSLLKLKCLGIIAACFEFLTSKRQQQEQFF